MGQWRAVVRQSVDGQPRAVSPRGSAYLAEQRLRDNGRGAVKAAGALGIAAEGGVVGAAAGFLLPAAAFAAEAAGPVWTLQALGRPALDLPVGQPVDEVTLPFD